MLTRVKRVAYVLGLEIYASSERQVSLPNLFSGLAKYCVGPIACGCL